MTVLFDFGISQEDFLTEQFVLEIQPGDRILSVASAGEVPLSILATNENIRLTAVDVSENQIRLCNLKFLASLHIEFPANGRFLGYAPMKAAERKRLFRQHIQPLLSMPDNLFWESNSHLLETGIVNAGRFEQYMSKLRFVAYLFIGKKNIRRLINATSVIEQESIFNRHIATRKSLQALFRIAFHPKIYRKRGLQEQALIHANTSTGERFYAKFRGFCTSAQASTNYFLHYFLTGKCQNEAAFPPYLKPENSERLLQNLANFELIHESFQTALVENKIGYFNKIHLSNLGDWMPEDEFNGLQRLLVERCSSSTIICYRYLQKNHFSRNSLAEFVLDEEISSEAEKHDRFPFYSILALRLKK